MSTELTITAEFIDSDIMLTVEHGNAERCQVLRLTYAEMLAAAAVAELAIATGKMAAAHYRQGMPRSHITRISNITS